MRGLRLVDLGEAPPGRDIWAGYHHDLRQLPRLRALLNHLSAELDAPLSSVCEPHR